MRNVIKYKQPIDVFRYIKILRPKMYSMSIACESSVFTAFAAYASPIFMDYQPNTLPS